MIELTNAVQSGLSLFMIIVLGILYLSITLTKEYDEHGNDALRIMILLQIAASAIDFPLRSTIASENSPWGNLALILLCGCCLGSVVVFSVYETIVLRERTFVSWIPIYSISFICGFATLIWASNLFGMRFIAYYNEDGLLIRTNTFFIPILVAVLVLTYDLLLAISCHAYLKKVELTCWILFPVLPFILCTINLMLGGTMLISMCFISTLILYVGIHIDRSATMAKRKEMLIEEDIRVKLHRMNPEFISDVLESIYKMIDESPDDAQNAISKFSDYLRANVNSIKLKEPVPFEMELKAIRDCTVLENLNSRQKIVLKEYIEISDFFIPYLAITNIIENITRYELTKGNNDIFIEINTYEDEGSICIEVLFRDVFFSDVEWKTQSDSGEYRSVKKRLADESNAAFSLTAHDNGTVLKVDILGRDANGMEVSE